MRVRVGLEIDRVLVTSNPLRSLNRIGSALLLARHVNGRHRHLPRDPLHIVRRARRSRQALRRVILHVLLAHQMMLVEVTVAHLELGRVVLLNGKRMLHVR